MSKVPIAFVENHILLREALAEAINEIEPYSVILQADNGKDFIEKLDPDNLPAIVVMDIEMPVMNGYAATLWLQQNYPSIKVIALSMIDTEYAINNMVKKGACAFIIKDAYPREFKITLDHVHQSGFYFGGEHGGCVRKAMLFSKDNQSPITSVLSETDIQFLELCCTAYSYKEIAGELKITVKQAEYLQIRLCHQFDLHNRTQLALFAIQNALVDFPPVNYAILN